MASELERAPADEEAEEATVIVGADEASSARDDTLAATPWPVSDLYYVDGEASSVPVDRPVDATSIMAGRPPSGPRLSPGRVVGATLAVLGAIGAVILGAVLLQSADDEPARSKSPAVSPVLRTSAGETAPTPPESTKVEVANVQGMTPAEARDSLDAQGLLVRVSFARAPQPRGAVYRQVPAAGAEVARGTTVALFVSRGATAASDTELIAVPRLVGLSASRAVAALRDAGLGFRIRTVSSLKPRGVVVAQSPEQGARLASGDIVALSVAKPRVATSVAVPDVVGFVAGDARRTLRAAGLRVVTTAVASARPAGVVLAQSPRAGAERRRGALVTLTVSSGPALVDVPDVTGLDELSARADLEQAGFQVRIVDEPTSDFSQDGVVLRQTPVGGSGARDGAVVTLVVGRLE